MDVPWSKDEPSQQPYYVYEVEKGHWQPVQGSPTIGNASSSTYVLRLYSWNIDFMLPFADSRMHAAIRHLESLVRRQPANVASVIFFQECVEGDLRLMAAEPWIQRTYHMTDIDSSNWQNGHYGTCTLVDRRLEVLSSFRVHFSRTIMDRDGLFVDISLGPHAKCIRLCNTHLESLALNPPRRPAQMQLVAHHLHASNVDGAVVAGDFNAIQDFDRTLHSINALKDAYLECGGVEEDPGAGHTWGQQAPTAQRDRYGTCRMDKIFFRGALECSSFERVGAGVEVESTQERADIVNLGFEKPWITDHLGVSASFELRD